MVGLAVSTATPQNASDQGLMFSQCRYIPFTNSTFNLYFIQLISQLFRSCNHKDQKNEIAILCLGDIYSIFVVQCEIDFGIFI